MKPFGALLGLAVSLVAAAPSPARGPSPDAAPTKTEADVPRISMADFVKGLAQDGLLVVDVRSAEQYLQGHIPGAISVPLALGLAGQVERLKSQKKPIVTYCG